MINYIELLSSLCYKFEQNYNDKNKKVAVLVKMFQTNNELILEVRFNMLVVFRQAALYTCDDDVDKLIEIHNDMAKRIVHDVVFYGIQGAWSSAIKINENQKLKP